MANKKEQVSLLIDDGAAGQQSIKIPLVAGQGQTRISRRGGKANVLLGDEDNVAPDEVKLQRTGDDLVVMFDGVDPDQGQLLIEGFYEQSGEKSDQQNVLAGMAEDGQYHRYASSVDADRFELAQLSPGSQAPHALSQMSLNSSLAGAMAGAGAAGGVAAGAATGAGAGGFLAALGGVGLGGAALAAGGGGGNDGGGNGGSGGGSGGSGGVPPSTGGPVPPGTGGPVPPGTGGPVPPGTGGPVPPGTGGPVPPGTGGPVPPGTGGPGQGTGFGDVIKNLDGSPVLGALQPTSAGFYSLGGMRFSGNKDQQIEENSSIGRFISSPGLIRFESTNGPVQEVKFKLFSGTVDAVVRLYNANGELIQTLPAVNNSSSGTDFRDVVFKAPQGQSIGYAEVVSAKPNGVIGIGSFTFLQSGASVAETLAGNPRLPDGQDATSYIMYVGGYNSNDIRINSNRKYAVNPGAGRPDGQYLEVEGDANTSFYINKFGVKSVSLDVASAKGGNSIKFYNAKNELLNEIPLEVTPGYNTTNFQTQSVAYQAPAGQSIAYFVVKTEVSYSFPTVAKIDNIKYSQQPGGRMALDSASEENDVLATQYHGGAQDDVLALDEVAYLATIKAGVHGGAGIDTLKLTGAGQTLDLAGLTGISTAAKISSFEKIDLTGGGDNTLKISLNDVLNLGGRDLFVADGKTQFMVNGDVGDKVALSNMQGNGKDAGTWAQASADVTVGGVVYNVYEHSLTHAELLVQQGVTTNLI